MKIRLHIERLVLDGLPIKASERPRLQVAMESELTQLLRNGGLPDELYADAALAQVRAGTVQVGKGSSLQKLGRDLAQAVQQGLGHSKTRQSVTVGRRLSAENRSSLPRGNRDE